MALSLVGAAVRPRMRAAAARTIDDIMGDAASSRVIPGARQMMRILWLVLAHFLGAFAVILVLPGMKLADAADACHARAMSAAQGTKP